jgi:hypothetical protein
MSGRTPPAREQELRSQTAGRLRRSLGARRFGLCGSSPGARPGDGRLYLLAGFRRGCGVGPRRLSWRGIARRRRSSWRLRRGGGAGRGRARWPVPGGRPVLIWGTLLGRTVARGPVAGGSVARRAVARSTVARSTVARSTVARSTVVVAGPVNVGPAIRPGPVGVRRAIRIRRAVGIIRRPIGIRRVVILRRPERVRGAINVGPAICLGAGLVSLWPPPVGRSMAIGGLRSRTPVTIWGLVFSRARRRGRAGLTRPAWGTRRSWRCGWP